jgi:hypothetical protein
MAASPGGPSPWGKFESSNQFAKPSLAAFAVVDFNLSMRDDSQDKTRANDFKNTGDFLSCQLTTRLSLDYL